jgi:hypothetical protein
MFLLGKIILFCLSVIFFWFFNLDKIDADNANILIILQTSVGITNNNNDLTNTQLPYKIRVVEAK